MKTGYKISDAMTRRPITVTTETHIRDCAKLMAKKHVGGLLIVDNEKLKGVLTEQDIVRKGIAKDKDVKNMRVKDVMEKNLITIDPNKDIYNALVIMRDKNIRHLPVMHKGEMLGLLTLKDILKIQPQLFDILVEKFEIREEERKVAPIVGGSEGICETCGNYTSNLHDVDESMVCSNCAKQS